MDVNDGTPLMRSARSRIRNRFHPQRHHYACFLILVAQAFERVVFYGVVGNLTYFLRREPLCWSEQISVGMPVFLVGLGNVMGLFGGWVSDSLCGRYRVILSTYAVYLLGHSPLIFLTHYTEAVRKDNLQTDMIVNEGLACNESYIRMNYPLPCKWMKGADPSLGQNQPCGAMLAVFMFIICAASGCINSNLPTFGGDQLREQSSETKQNFFRYYYLAINIGGLISMLPIAFLQQYNYMYSFIATTICLFLSATVFLAGTKLYVRRGLTTSPLTNIVKVVFSSIRQKWRNRGLNAGEKPSSFLDYAAIGYGGNYTRHVVSDVKAMMRVIKTQLLFIPFLIAYSEAEGAYFLLQGLHLRVDMYSDSQASCPTNSTLVAQMVDNTCNSSSTGNSSTAIYPNKASIHSHDAMIPPAAFTIFDTIAVIVFILFLSKIYNFLSRRGVKITVTWRLVVGHIFLSLSLCCCAVLEKLRLNDIHTCGYYYQQIGTTVYDASRLLIWWQIPQYVFIGISEVFVILTGIEYAFLESPASMQGIMMGVYWFFDGIGSILAIPFYALIQNIPKILDNNQYINCNQLYFYMLALVLCTILGAVIIFFSARCFNLHLDRVHIVPQVFDDSPSPPTGRRYGSVNKSSSPSRASECTSSITDSEEM